MAVHQTRGRVARAELDRAVNQLRAVRLAVVFHGVRLSDDPDLLILVLAVAAPGDLQAALHARDGLVLVVHHSASLVGDGHVGDDVVVVRAVRNVRYGAFHRRRHNVAGQQGCEFARCHGVVHAVIVHGVAAVGMRLAVILPGVAVRGDLDFGFVLPDLQRAGHVGDNIVPGYVVVVFVNDDRGLRHKPAFVHADHGLAAIDGNRLHLVAGREVFRRVASADLDLIRGVQLRAVRLAVVVDGVVRGNDLHKVLLVQTAFGDGQLAILHDEGYRREVRVPVHEAVRREVHRILVRVRSLGVRGRAVGKAEVRFRVQRVADAHDLVAVHFMLLAVVLNRVLVAPDRHDHGVRRGDRQLAVLVTYHIVPGYIVALSVHELRAARYKPVLVLANGGLGAADDNRLHLVAVRQIRDRVADAGLDLALVVQLHAVRLAVVDNGVIRRRQNDLHVARAALGNRQRAGYVGDIVVRGYFNAVPVHDDRIAGNQLIRVHARVRFAAFDGKRLHAVPLRQIRNRVARADLNLSRGVQLRAVRPAVVFHGVVRGGDLHLVFACAAFGDRQRAGDEGDGLILTLRVLASGVYDGQLVDGVVASRAVRDIGHRLGDPRLHNVAGWQLHGFARFHGVVHAVIVHGVAAVGMRLAVILPGVAVRGDGDGLLVLSDRQRAVGLGEFIVASLRALVQRIGERVRTAANHRLAARKRIRRAFARHKAVFRLKRSFSIHKRRSIVRLAQVCRFQRYLALVDGQLAVDGIAEGVVLRHVCFAAHDRVALNDVLAFVAHVRGAALDDCGQLIVGRQHALGEGEAVIRQRGSVVGPLFAVRGDGD